MNGSPEGKVDGEWDWDGALMPRVGHEPVTKTFSIGIFQWIRKAGRPGLFHGKVKRQTVTERIYGKTSNPQEAIDRAKARVAELNAKGRR